jgi:hypothetical protein
MARHVQFELGTDALAFVRDELSNGGPLAKRLLAVPAKGQVFGILPAKTAPADLTDFGSGGVASGDESLELADLIGARLSETQSICVFEHPTSREGDPRMPDVDYFIVGARVYAFLTTSSDHETIIKAARETHWYPSIGLISALMTSETAPRPRSAMTVSFLDDLVVHAQAIVVGAYDAESWLIWYPEGHTRSPEEAS